MTENEKLEAERDHFRARCEQLVEERDTWQWKYSDLNLSFGRLRTERDEARQWAANLYKENSKLHKIIAFWKSEEADWVASGVALRAQLAEALDSQDNWETTARMWEHSCGLRCETKAGLREQLLNERKTSDMVYAELVEEYEETKHWLAEARNKALDEADAICTAKAALWVRGPAMSDPLYTLLQAANAIRALKL